MLWIWVIFVAFVLLLLVLDLAVLHRRPHAIGLAEAVRWSVFWIGLGIAFALVIYPAYEFHWAGIGTQADAVDGAANDGTSAALKYLAGYLLEKSLSVDNLFVIAVIFRFLAVPAELQHRVLFWGLVGALALRGFMIGVGVELITHYHWVLYVLGAFLLVTAARMLLWKERAFDPARDPVLRVARRVLPMTEQYHGWRFWVIENGRWLLTPLALALLLIETADVVFAVDSIPAVFGVTADPLLVFTSNIFAVLGLRALYFALAGLLEKLRYLKVSLALILMLVGGKMLAGHWISHILGRYATLWLLAAVVLLLAAGAAASGLRGARSDLARSSC